ncbi:class I SAM-dependent methyltransferase [Streptomyces sp. ODS28]|uniref:class I SAM-dependent methyltransferase n=1 Tax=Streptomyces sp. ODS28 TaxID=3136688 RepID=UPI0031ED3206
MNVSMRYAESWESFWRDAPPGAGSVAWDAAPDSTAALHLPLLERYSHGGLPMIDAGCGNGTQTLFLAERYPRVLGFDLSGEAVERAAKAAEAAREELGERGRAGRGGQAPRVEFRQLDATDLAAVRELHDELGDADVYMRGVLHQAQPDDRRTVASSLAALIGERGCALVVEPAAAAKQVMLRLMGREEGPPPQLEAIFGHGIEPMDMPDEELPAYFRGEGLTVLASGTMPLSLTVSEEDGSYVTLPSNWLVASRV